MSRTPSIIWFRRDLRLADNQALNAAIDRGGPVIPVYILPPETEAPSLGHAARWWLNASMMSLDRDLRSRGSRLIVLEGAPATVLRDLLAEARAEAVYWNRLYEPAEVRRDAALLRILSNSRAEVATFEGSLLREPWAVLTKSGGPYRVFGPFHRALISALEPSILSPAPGRIPPPAAWPRAVSLRDVRLECGSSWPPGFETTWVPGEQGASVLLARFCRGPLREYPTERDRPGRIGTSRLSPHLHFGEITPGRILLSVGRAAAVRREPGWVKAAETFRRQLIWREFAHHLLHHFPSTPSSPLREEFARFPWRRSKRSIEAWREGRTGYPIVDAGMRELLATGWLHNRVRMIAASFLVKDMLVPWSDGARWFREALVDADLANNTLGWQWVAGCGADAAPFFRIFNPVVQGERFDPDGEYVRRWIPEIAAIPNEWIHRPWEAPRDILRSAGVRIGVSYPAPVVEHAVARTRALEALASMRRKGRSQ